MQIKAERGKRKAENKGLAGGGAGILQRGVLHNWDYAMRAAKLGFCIIHPAGGETVMQKRNGKAESGRGFAGNRHRSAMNCATPVVVKVGRIVRKNDENAVFAAKRNVRKRGSGCGARGWRFSRRELCENRPNGFAKRWDGHWLMNNRAVRVEKETAAETSGICQPGRVRRINWAKT